MDAKKKCIGGSVFNGYSSLAEIILTGTMTSIDNYAFRWCSSLKTIALSDCVAYIGENAFEGCTAWPMENFKLQGIEIYTLPEKPIYRM